MQITTKKNVLQTFNHEISENRKVVVFLDGVTVHPEALVRKYSNINLFFFSKNTTSWLQPLDVVIIKRLQVKYEKQLIRYVLTLIDFHLHVPSIAKAVDILRAIKWVAAAWNEASFDTIKHWFAKCRIIEQMAKDKDDGLNEALAGLVKMLTSQISSGLSAEKLHRFWRQKVYCWTYHWLRPTGLERNIKNTCIQEHEKEDSDDRLESMNLWSGVHRFLFCTKWYQLIRDSTVHVDSHYFYVLIFK